MVSMGILDEKIVVKTKHGELTLEQLAEVQPGLARLMKEIGDRFHVLYYAAKGGNWKLAEHEQKVTISILKVGATLRPKYQHDINTFIQSHLHSLGECIKAKDWKQFENAYKGAVVETNKLHEKYGYGFIHYKLSKDPPSYYDLGSRD
jgi:hypothetical protein